MQKTNKYLWAAVVLLFLVLVGVLAYFLTAPPKQSDEVVRLKAENERLKLLLNEQRSETARLETEVASLKKTLIPDTVYLRIKNGYNAKIDNVHSLDADGQIEFLSKWLSEADSL